MSKTLGELGVLEGGRTIADVTSISNPEDVRRKGGIGWDEFMRIYHQMRTVVREECDEETARRIDEAWTEIPL